jgi:hypothetical protein
MMIATFLAALTLTIDPSRTLSTFDPRIALGATIDVHDEGQNEEIFTPVNLRAMQSAGFHPLSYRLATELDGEAWHWNPHGTWSDPARQQGYWTSSDKPGLPIELSYGYRLPRRGNTLDQAHNDSYSRIDDDDPGTFWKSNPYLDGRPQWFFINLGDVESVASIRIRWAVPFATEFRVQYWNDVDPINYSTNGDWIDFPNGVVRDGSGGEVSLGLAEEAIDAQYVRVLMTRSSNTAPPGAGDPRDALGFAVAEVSLFDEDGEDLVEHGRTKTTQSIIWTSSTDPWHRSSDLDRSVEQLGLDRLYDTGLTNGLPMLTPVALLYGTPEDAAEEVRYLLARHRPLERVEMGEEPDGQLVTPEDYATLYLRWADALHAIDPKLQLGGPAFQSTYNIIRHWREREGGRTSWIGRFVDELRARGRLADFAFFSFEWYPFDNLCLPSHPQLLEEPLVLDRVLGHWRDEGVPRSIPWLATEYGYSSYGGQPEVDITAALFNADFIGQFLTVGGTAAYFYGLEPDILLQEAKCATWGNLMLFLSDDEHRIRYPLAAFYSATLITKVWANASGGHDIHAVSGTSPLLTAYAVHRPDHRWALLVINKDATKAMTVRLRLGDQAVEGMDVHQFSPHEYVWHARGKRGYPSPDRPPRVFRVDDQVMLPAMSVSVIVFDGLQQTR